MKFQHIAALSVAVTMLAGGAIAANAAAPTAKAAKATAIDGAIAALRTANVKAYAKHTINMKRLKKGCPALVKKMGKKKSKAAGKRLAAGIAAQVKVCGAAFDWTTAKEVSRTKGVAIDSSKSRCAKGVKAMDSASALFNADGQGWRVTFGRSLVVGSKRYFSVPPTCEKTALPR